MRQSNKIIRVLLIALIHVILFSACKKHDANYIMGESLVLADTLSGKLCFDALIKDRFVIRSTYQGTNPLCKIYKEGIDYTIDYEKGELLE